MSVKDRWAEAGRTTLTLPSGFRVRGVMPSPSEVVRLKIIPQTLRRAVIGFTAGGRMLSELSEDEHAQLVDARRYQAAAFVREMAPPGTTGEEGWEAVTVTRDDLASMPPGDVERLDDLIGGYATAEMITTESEYALGIRTREDVERVAEEEAGDTVDGWTGFRGGPGGDDAGTVGADVVDPAVGDVGDSQPVDRTPRRRRTRTQTHVAGAGDGPIATT
jgi:hypothetical protein